MGFNQHKLELIDKLQNSSDYKKDEALQNVVEILKRMESGRDLKKQKALIDRISIDSVLDWDLINLISEFTHSHT